MTLYENSKYIEDIKNTAALDLPWDKLQNRTLMLSGATGLLGSFLVDVIMEKNAEDGLNCTVYALGRNRQKAEDRFSKYINDPKLNRDKVMLMRLWARETSAQLDLLDTMMFWDPSRQ